MKTALGLVVMVISLPACGVLGGKNQELTDITE
jgi:hypothetical protein